MVGRPSHGLAEIFSMSTGLKAPTILDVIKPTASPKPREKSLTMPLPKTAQAMMVARVRDATKM